MPSIYDLAAALKGRNVEAFVQKLSDDQVLELLYDFKIWRLEHQEPPPGRWRYWLLLAGRGTGKTHTGSKMVSAWAAKKKTLGNGVILIGGRTHDEVVDSLILGSSGILAQTHPDFRPRFFRDEVRWPNGVRGIIASGDEPKSFRRHNVAKAWLDEMAFWKYPRECFREAFDPSLRVGDLPQVIITTSPTKHPLIRELRDAGQDSKDTRHVYTNAHTDTNPNLNPDAVRALHDLYDGTRIGLSELGGLILDEHSGALLTYRKIEETRIRKQHEPYDKIVVSVDPLGSDDSKKRVEDPNERRECGIVVGGSYGKHAAIIRDYSLAAEAKVWAAEAVRAYRENRANYILAETNFGGGMVEAMIKAIDDSVPVRVINAHRSKRLRAEPVAAKYEQGYVHHIGVHEILESQWCNWIPGMSDWSPDRLDACVHLITDLLLPEERPTGSIYAYAT